MKIQPEHYAKLQAAMKEVLAKNPDAVQRAATLGYSNMRLNWDILWASKIDGQSAGYWLNQNLYPYLNDSHISTALASIMGNDGKNAKGKR